MTGPVGAALLVAHILSAVVSYGALGATGLYARAARTAADPFVSGPVRQYFRPGHNLAGRVIFIVPALGLGLLATEPSGEFARAYPWIGVAVWTISIAVATGTLWPAEHALQELIAAGPGRAGPRCARVRERSSGRRGSSPALVVAVVVMIARF